MFKNYLTIAWRNLLRNKAFSIINILGLSIGISSALVIYLVAHYDNSFDRFEQGGDRIYRVVGKGTFENRVIHYRATPAPLGDAIRANLSGAEEVSSFRYYREPRTAAGNVTFKSQPNVIFADNHYLNLLSYKTLAGSADLTEPGRVVLDASRARLYFPRESYPDIIGQRITYNDSVVATVSGVVADLDERGNTDFSFREFVSLATMLDNKYLREQNSWDEWGNLMSDQQLFVRLAKGVRPSVFESGLARLNAKYQVHKGHELELQPLSDIHFNSQLGTIENPSADRSALFNLVLIAVFLLLLGCINFINLTTAQATRRAREIGVRKTMGSSRSDLVRQFLCETFVLTALATALSLAVTPFLLRTFSGFIPQGVRFSPAQPYVLAFGAILVCAVSLLAGFYPAMVLSSWKPVQVLKGQVIPGDRGKARIRQSLTVFQFVIAQAFVIATFAVSKQINFLLNQDVGFQKEAVFGFRTSFYTDTAYGRRKILLQQIQRLPGVSQAGLASDMPLSSRAMLTVVTFNGVETNVEVKSGDTSYLGGFHIALLAGRAPVAADASKEVVINETYLHVLGFKRPQETIGQLLSFGDERRPIVGVMKDIYVHPMNHAGSLVKPLIFTEGDERAHQFFVKLPGTAAMDSWTPTIARIETLFKKAYPNEDFEPVFLDDVINNFYINEQKTEKLLGWTMGVTIFISCIGLLGLVMYTTRQRVKEIGVRKVLGASVTSIVRLLSTEFVRLVAIAFAVATPLSWWALHRWLQNYAVRTELSWWVFAISGAGMILIALATLSLQTVRAARANPVDSLRNE